MNKYLDYVKNDEPILSGALIGAFLLAVADKVFHLSDGDLSLYGPIALVVGGAIFRQLVYSPNSFLKALYSPPPPQDPPQG